jgi:L-threonylcarbamoyladenylate synthase
MSGGERHMRARMAAAAQHLLAQGERVGVLALEPDLAAFDGLAIHRESLGETLDQAAARLFAALRALDAAGCTVILARGYGDAGLGAALWDRLLRAAEGHVVVE